jgi:hypothetical protein
MAKAIPQCVNAEWWRWNREGEIPDRDADTVLVSTEAGIAFHRWFDSQPHKVVRRDGHLVVMQVMSN